MRTLNKVMMIGRLGADAEMRHTPSGVAVSNFNLATNRSWKDKQTDQWKEETDWHRIVAWRMENLSQYLTKGQLVHVEGRLQTRSWEDQNGNKRYMTEVVADQIILLGSKGNGAGSAPAEQATNEASNDDVPF